MLAFLGNVCIYQPRRGESRPANLAQRFLGIKFSVQVFRWGFGAVKARIGKLQQKNCKNCKKIMYYVSFKTFCGVFWFPNSFEILFYLGTVSHIACRTSSVHILLGGNPLNYDVIANRFSALFSHMIYVMLLILSFQRFFFSTFLYLHTFSQLRSLLFYNISKETKQGYIRKYNNIQSRNLDTNQK